MFKPSQKGILLFFLALLSVLILVGGIVFSEGSGLWIQRESVPLGVRYGNSVAGVGGKIYSIGGYNSAALALTQEYNPDGGVWLNKSPMFTPRIAFAVAVWDGKIYAIGGNSNGVTVAAIEVYDPLADQWNFVTNLPTPRYGHRAEVVNGVIYVMGGRNSNNQYFDLVEAYDIDNQTWLAPRSPIPGGLRYYFGSAVVNGKIYAIGGLGIGSIFLNRVDIYDPESNLWTPGANMLTDRDFLETVAVNGKIYAIGGLNSNGPLTVVEEYNPATDIWVDKANLDISRRAFGAAEAGGKIYVIAGVRTSSFQLTDTMEEYTPAPPVPSVQTVNAGDGRVTLIWNSIASTTGYRVQRADTPEGTYTTIAELSGVSYTDCNRTNETDYYYRVIAYNAGGESVCSATQASRPKKAEYSWTTASLPNLRRNHVTEVVNGKIYVIGGFDANNQMLQTVEEYDPGAGTWTPKASMISLRRYFEAAMINNKIYVIGGENSAGQYLNTVEEYDPSLDRWVTKAAMPTARERFGIAAANGKIYVSGGIGTPPGYLKILEEYDPVDLRNGTDIYGNPMGYWTPRPSMNQGRYNLGLAAVNGNLYAMGGSDNFGLAKVEVYNIQAETWSDGVNLPEPRSDFKIEVVNNRIYTISGKNSSYNILTNQVEEFDPESGQWTTKPPLVDMRWGFGSVVIEDAIYVIGGGGGIICWLPLVFTVEKYHPLPLTAMAAGSGITLKWYGVIGAVSYKVKRAAASGTDFTVIAENLTATSYSDTNGVTNGNYYYIVLAVNAQGQEIMVSNEAWEVFGLRTPINVQTSVVPEGIKVTWGGVPNAASYRVKWSNTPGGPYSNLSNSTPTWSVHNNASHDVVYYYVVSAVNANGESACSEEVSGQW